ncbi:hypothetical protein DKX38_030084 (mitochondrion) [Salix brachista]|uniref:Uncharacterized protein n=1 Tax=Salix brachista TaxID=2182728 RepID=A0A5N5IVF0_9ROSI|nr:hypothetical protein DKX38_030084 [Salix brachista]
MQHNKGFRACAKEEANQSEWRQGGEAKERFSSLQAASNNGGKAWSGLLLSIIKGKWSKAREKEVVPSSLVNLVRSILREKEGSTVNEWEDWSSIFISRKDSTSSKNEQEKAYCLGSELLFLGFESCLSHFFVVDFREEKGGIRQRRKAHRAKLGLVGLPTRTRPPECLLGSGRSQADTYDRRRKDPHSAWASLIEDWRGEVEEKARDGFRSLCASRMRIPIQDHCSSFSGGCRTDGRL